jgi:CBS domain containing-hemolysin-like protein
MEELAIKNAAPKTAELLPKNLNFKFCFLVAIFCAAIKHRCVTHLYRIPLLSLLTFLLNIRQLCERKRTVYLA